MSQVLSQAIPLWLAGHRRSEVLPEKLVRRAMEALGGESPSLLRACGARFGDPEQITLWIGSTLGARDARQIVEDLRLKVSSRSTDFSTDAIESDSMLVRAVGPRGELAIFAIGERVYWVQAESAQMDSALTELRPWQ
jgi:hypothetical protein